MLGSSDLITNCIDLADSLLTFSSFGKTYHGGYCTMITQITEEHLSAEQHSEKKQNSHISCLITAVA